MLINESLNIGNLYRQGEFKLQSDEEARQQAKREYEEAKRQGKING